MFTGDGSGDFLTPALHRAGLANQSTSVGRGDGLRLRDGYIVAVAHCVPPANKPTAEELAECRPFLIDHLRLLPEVRVIVPLGKIAHDGLMRALEAMGHDLPAPRPAFRHAARVHVGPYAVLSTYHPSRQNTQTGRLTPSMFDAILRRARGLLAD
jgi:uracil-DNA glycosylase family 4